MLTGQVVAGADATILALADITSLTLLANSDASVLAKGNFNGDLTATTGDADLFATGTIQGSVTAGHDATVGSLSDIAGSNITASGNVDLLALGLISGTDIQGDEGLFVWSYAGLNSVSLDSVEGDVHALTNGMGTLVTIQAHGDVLAAALNGPLHVDVSSTGQQATLFGMGLLGQVDVDGNLDAVSFNDLYLDPVYVGGNARIGATGIVTLVGQAVGNVYLTSYTGLFGIMTAGNDLSAWSLGTIDAHLTAVDNIDTVITYGSLLGTLVAGPDANPAVDPDPTIDGYGNIRRVHIWNHLQGAILAYNWIGEVFTGGEIGALGSISAAGIGRVEEFNRSPFVEDPQIPVAKIGHLVSLTKDAYRNLLDLETDLQQAETELLAIVQASAADVQNRLSDATTELNNAKAEARAKIDDIKKQAQLYLMKAEFEVEQVFDRAKADVEAARLEALDNASVVNAETQQQLTALQGQADARRLQADDEKQFLIQEANNLQQTFDATRAANLEQMAALRDCYSQTYAATFIDQMQVYALDCIQDKLDMIGTLGDIVPVFGWIISGVADGLNAAIYFARGEYLDGAISVFCMIPYASIAKRTGLTDYVSNFAKPLSKQAGNVTVGTSKFVPLPPAGNAAKMVPCDDKRIIGEIGCFEADTLVADGAEHTTQYVVAIDASSRWYWGVTIGALGAAAVCLVGGRRIEDEKKRKHDALDRFFFDKAPDTPEPWSEPDDLAFVDPPNSSPTPQSVATATDQLLSTPTPKTPIAVLDRPRPARIMTRNEPDPPPTRPMSAATPRKPCISFRWPLIGLLLLIAAASGFLGLETSREATQPLPVTQVAASHASLPSGTIERNGVRYRPIQTYHPCDRALGKNPELTDIDRAHFGPEPNPATWKLLTLLAPKIDGSTADVSIVQPPEWLAEHNPQVGGTVPISVPECGIDGNAEVLAIRPCPPVKPGPGQVVLATFRHHVDSTVQVHVTSLDTPIGCTGNHPFWSEDRQTFIRANELRHDERLSAFTQDAYVDRIDIDPTPKFVYNLMVQGERVYHVSQAAVVTVRHVGLEAVAETVYNIEVDDEHVYRVSSLGLLVHNASFGGPWSVVGRIEYGSSDLAQLAIQARRQTGTFTPRNVCVIEYRAADGSLRTMTTFSERNVGHAERLLAKDLDALGIDPSCVTRIFSELEPCSVPGGYCKDFINRTFPQAEVTWAFEYGVDRGSRRRGVEALRRVLGELSN